MSITSDLASFAAQVSLDSLPSKVIARIRLLVLDLAGIAVRARHDAESTPALLAAAHALGFTKGQNHIFGDSAQFSPAGAALINATFAHSLDFDDTHAAAIVHPGATVIPAVLSAAEMVRASGPQVIAAIAAGYEVALRLALALPAAAHYERGFHPSATCGAFGAAAAAGRIFGMDAAGISSALGIALSESAGSLQFLANGAWTKRFQVGWASMAGLVAATLAREGFKGAADPIEGRYGFLRAYSPSPVPERVTQDLGQIYELMATGVKPYPSCRWGHAGIDAALALREELGLNFEEVESATLGISHAGLLLIGEPAAKKADPQNVVDGQFSGPFVIAVALATGTMDWDSYRLLDDPHVRSLLPRIVCENDPEVEAEFPANMSGKLTLRARGHVFTRKVVVPKGEPSTFPSEVDLRAKFNGLAGAVLGPSIAAKMVEDILRLEQLNDGATILCHAHREEVTPSMVPEARH